MLELRKLISSISEEITAGLKVKEAIGSFSMKI